ncbi:MAG: galactokinase [Lachnospiraceae bacterium]
MKEELITLFEQKFGTGGDIRCYFSPGRVNLIGEHTDYNGGHVFPCALTLGTYLIARKRGDKKLRFYSKNFHDVGILEGSLEHLVWNREAGWTNYPMGVIWAMQEKGYSISNGFDILLYGNIPNGSGLSSSASVEVGTGVMLNDMYEFGIDMVNLALIGQYAENHFNQVQCGIMDQFAIAMGKKDHAIFLDTATLSYTYAPLALESHKIVIACSNKKRELADSKYNERRTECMAALSEIKEFIGIHSLCELTSQQFELYKTAILDETWLKRARHAVYENQRTITAVEVLKSHDLKTFGMLMTASHNSLKDDYEVTGRELDTLVEAALEQNGVLGSRMTGAGFGGCTISLVENESIPSFIENVGTKYLDTIGYAADFYVAEIGDGARRI